MIMSNYKQILFKWILEIGSVRDLFFHLDDFNIDEFFLQLFHQIQSVKNFPNLTLLRDGNLVEALRVFAVQSHIFESTKDVVGHVLSQIDCCYLFFLLLHFTYVKYTKNFCKKLCKNLSMESREIISEFMSQLFYCSSFTTQVIRDAIIHLNPCKITFNCNYIDIHPEGLRIKMFKITPNNLNNLKKENYFPQHTISNAIKKVGREKYLKRMKINSGENQVIICKKHFKAMDIKLTEVREKLKQKDEAIQYLLDKKDKLEQILTKVLSLSDCSNFTAKICLQHCETSNIQDENILLKRELNKMRIETIKLAKQMQSLTQKHKRYFSEVKVDKMTVVSENFVIEEKALEYLSEAMKTFINYVEELSKVHKKEKIRKKRLQQDIFEVTSQSKNLGSRMTFFENEVAEISAYMKNIEAINKVNQQSLSQIANCKNYIKTLVEKNEGLTSKLQRMKDEYEESKINTDVTEQNFISIIGSLQKNLEEYQELNSKLICENSDLQRSINILNEKFNFDKSESTDKNLMAKITSSDKSLEALKFSYNELEEKNRDLTATCERLGKELKIKASDYRINVEMFAQRLSEQNSEIAKHKSMEFSIEEQYQKLLVEYEDVERKLRICDKQLELARVDLLRREEQAHDLQIECDGAQNKNADLRTKLANLMQKLKHEKKTADLTIKRKEKQIKDTQNENKRFEKLLIVVQRDNEHSQKEVKKLSKHIRDFYRDIDSIWSILRQGDENGLELYYQEIQNERCLDVCFAKIRLRLYELLDFKKVADETIKDLNLELNAKESELKNHQEKLQLVLKDREEMITNYERLVVECKNEVTFSEDVVKGYEDKLKDLKLGQRIFIEIMEKKPYGNILDAITRLTSEKLSQYEEQIERVLDENNKLGKDINIVKTTQTELSNQLFAHIEIEREIVAKLKETEGHCKGLEQKLESTYLTEYVDQVHKLSSYIVTQTKQIEELQVELDETVTQKEVAVLAKEIVSEQLQSEENEKEIIAKSLESLTIQLKLSVEHTDALESLCIELRGKLNEANALSEKLQNDAVTRENELNLQCQTLQNERADMQNRIVALRHQVAEQTENIQGNNAELIHVIDTLKDKLNVVFTREMQSSDAQKVFETKVDGEGTPFNDLKNILNKMMLRIMEWKVLFDANQDNLDYLQVLEMCNSELEKQLKLNEAKTYELQDTIASGELSSSLHLKNVQKANENLMAENGVLSVKLEAHEKEIMNLETQVANLAEKLKKYQKFKHSNMILMKALKEKLKSKQSINMELHRMCAAQLTDIKEKSSIIHNQQKDLADTAAQHSELTEKLEKLQFEVSLNDSYIKVLNEKCRSVLESNMGPDEIDISIQSGKSVGLQGKIIQLVCLRNNLTKCISVYKRYLRDVPKKTMK